MADNRNDKGISLAKGPVALIGLALLAYGISGLILGGNDFATQAVDGTVQGDKWLGLEGNGWTNLLFAGAGALLLFGSPLHWGAKSLSLIVGLALGAASVIALIDKDDVFGIFAANGLTKLVWGIAAAVLLVLALLPRVGGRKDTDDDDRREPVQTTRRVQRETQRAERVEPIETDRGEHVEPIETNRVERVERVEPIETPRADTAHADGRVVAPADGSTPESQETTRRQRDL